MLLQNFIALFLESAPWLLLGLILAGWLKVFVPMSWMNQQLGGHGLTSIIKAALLGAPLPLCSCGVIPAAVALRRSGASKAATTSFLVSTPETGIDSVSVSYVLLGPFMAIVRPISAVMSAIVAGLLVGKDEPTASQKQNLSADKKQPTTSCCSHKAQALKPVLKPKVTDEKTPLIQSCCATSTPIQSCCSSDKKQNEQSTHSVKIKRSITSRMGEGLHYAATSLIKDTTLWLLIGLFFAALVATYVPNDFLTQWGNGILAMLVMVLVSVPMYICATASTPIAAGLLLAGVSPGAVLVFMLAGPATNIATLGVVRKELGMRALWAYLSGVLGVALISGFIVNYLVANLGISVTPQIGPDHQLLPNWLAISSGIILAILMINAFIQKILNFKWQNAKQH